MNDRELLEAAAKAAGLNVEGLADKMLVYPERWAGGLIITTPTGGSAAWNPLTDDGDALRLAVALGLAVIPYPIFAKPKHSVIAKQYDHARHLRGESEDVRIEEIQVYGDDPAAATRRAILKAAAAMVGGA